MKRNYDKKDDKKIPRTPIKPLKPKAEQNLTPTDVWTNVVNTLSKASETHEKEEKQKTFDFSEYEERAKNYKQGTNVSLFDVIENGFLYNVNNTFEKEKPLPSDFPSFFPTKKLADFDCSDIYQKLDVDTLFFIFYNDVNTVRQMNAAKQLKQKSWRYHTKYTSWFQRMDEPKIMTEDYEQGTFLFFDYESTWTNRKKKDFTFEYKYLEDIEM